MAMTISSSISVKPLGGAELAAARLAARQMRITCDSWDFSASWSRPESPGPFEKMLQRIDAKGKCGRSESSCQLVSVSRLALGLWQLHRASF